MSWDDQEIRIIEWFISDWSSMYPDREDKWSDKDQEVPGDR